MPFFNSRSFDGEGDDTSNRSGSGSRRSFRSRADEKQALSEFNDRLANYIEVRLFWNKADLIKNLESSFARV
jgi:hypothetical protein